MLEIYQELANIASKGERAVLATVIASSGSTPRKAGAKMLIKEDGTTIGTVGGGGNEQQVLGKVNEVMSSGQPQVMHFDPDYPGDFGDFKANYKRGSDSWNRK